MPPDDFDLPRYVGQRSGTFRWRLLDGVTGVVRGELHPLRDTSPQLSHDTTSTISRRVSQVTLGAVDAGLINPLRDRVELSMVTVTGRRREERPLGRYMVADATSLETSGGTTAPITLYDEMFVVDQELDAGFNAGGRAVDQAAYALLDGLPIGDVQIDATDQTADNGWSAGTSRASALADLANLGGYFKPWFNHRHQLRMMRAFEPAARPPTIDLDASPRVVAGSVTRSNDLLTAPNRYVVVSNAVGEEQTAPIVGTYDVPSSAPHSIQQVGYVRPKVTDAQVSSVTQARIYARTLGIQDAVYERVELTTPADPRHDGYDVVRWDGLLWLETAWQMTLTVGGPMRHTLRRAYGSTTGDEL
ncbi:hypothetical protein [Micromonospora sp. WMMC273]|uniref:hypothetical protein n=1 Tax=Micromonospora sp. WMMC273 TaxID=3015157 RepID=UPI0022B6BA8C|nr:hypothetical protein [Micromonospora sp. WMMC273]MCZ7478874.1 hypothetical protein [Micromonospora sp. WMMC273]MCZ7478983.1 hypothetical protein [Micromonospora sp. WMMC273]